MICQMCHAGRYISQCAFCRGTGAQPTNLDFVMGGPFLVFDPRTRQPLIAHASTDLRKAVPA